MAVFWALFENSSLKLNLWFMDDFRAFLAMCAMADEILTFSICPKYKADLPYRCLMMS